MAESPQPPAQSSARPPPDPSTPVVSARLLVALVIGQVGIHASMSGLRMAAPLQALREGYSAWSVGLLLALFAAAPVVLAMHSGRLADRHGYHLPVRLAVVLTGSSALLAVLATFVEGPLHVGLLCLAAMGSGTGANMGMLAIQRTAGLSASNPTERVRIFSWLGVAPSLANVIGAVAAGFAIDLGGFAVAYGLMAGFVLVTWFSARRVPPMQAPGRANEGAGRGVLSLLQAPGMKRLLLANWLLSTCWDAHTFAVPIIGHDKGFNASTIGLILGTFTLTVTAIRMLIPVLAHRLEASVVIRGAMLGCALSFLIYPLASTPLQMGACAVMLGVFLGSTQPMIMATLHRITPDNRHGESLAFRSMAINLSSTLMPLGFGVAGVAVGAAWLFWSVGAVVAVGSMAVGALRR